MVVITEESPFSCIAKKTYISSGYFKQLGSFFCLGNYYKLCFSHLNCVIKNYVGKEGAAIGEPYLCIFHPKMVYWIVLIAFLTVPKSNLQSNLLFHFVMEILYVKNMNKYVAVRTRSANRHVHLFPYITALGLGKIVSSPHIGSGTWENSELPYIGSKHIGSEYRLWYLEERIRRI